jgi:hypothetical protein
LAILGAGVYYLLPGNTNNENPFDPAEAGFNITDTASIGKLFISAADGESVTVERTDSGWMVNKQYPALRSTLDMLLTTMMKQTPLYPVTKSAYENAVRTMSTHGIKTEVYDRAGKKMKVFYVGGPSVNNTGTNMLMEGAKTPYVVETRGFVGYLTPRYTPRIRDWRDRTVFNIPANEIQSVSVQYADKPEHSYTVTRAANDSILVSADAAAMKNPDGLNHKRANMYLRFFSNINCEGYLNGLSDNDTTFKTAPKRASIELVTKKGRTQHVDLYWMAVNKRSKNQKQSNFDEAPQDYDADRMYAVINNYRDTIMVQQLTFHNILRRGKEFYGKDITPPTVSGNQIEIRTNASTH